jgi:hypothetical protein
MHLFEKHRQATGRESTGPQLDKGPGSLEIRAAFYQPLNRPRQGSVWVSKKILYATNSGGNICSQSFSLIFDSASAGIHASVSNRSPHVSARSCAANDDAFLILSDPQGLDRKPRINAFPV